MGNDKQGRQRDECGAAEGALDLAWPDGSAGQQHCRTGKRDDVRADLVMDQGGDHASQDDKGYDLFE